MATKTEKYIKQVFPLIEKIKDDSIRDKVVKVWARVWKESGYATLEEAPMVGPAEDTLVKHTNAVTNSSSALASQFQEEYGYPVNLDTMLAGALLHDVDKLVIYERKDGKVGYSPLGKKIPHGSYGGHVALEEGLPMEIVSLIITHAGVCTWDPVSVEGVFLYHADFAKIDAVRFVLGWKK